MKEIMEKAATIKRSKHVSPGTLLLIVILGVLGSPSFLFAQSTSTLSESVDAHAVVVSNTISPAPPPSPSPIGNNGVPLTDDSGTDTAVFKGYAYPGSSVAILKNGLIVNELPANPDGTFEVPVRNIKAGVYTFGVRAKDKNGLLSAVLTYTISITANQETQVQNIFIAPTITTDKIEVIQGSTLTFYGSTFPRADITLNIFARSGIIRQTKADNTGAWSYVLPTKGLDYGDYNAKSLAKTDKLVSLYSNPVSFTIGTSNKARAKATPIRSYCDLNNDSRVNLLDFSIMAFWYKRLGFPAKVDLNSDNRVNLIDLSILAYCWTG